ncbi:MAG TPA: DUF2934 domain-containing protein [Acidobacteriota bacterium]|jgi:hypothetical protein|nr:DUF2934 domain-containing protein [Acidobacteriota bacterium]
MDKNEIAKLAYALYADSGCKEGRDLDNWIEAEKILAAQEKVQLKSADDLEFNEISPEEKEVELEESPVVL